MLLLFNYLILDYFVNSCLWFPGGINRKGLVLSSIYCLDEWSVRAEKFLRNLKISNFPVKILGCLKFVI